MHVSAAPRAKHGIQPAMPLRGAAYYTSSASQYLPANMNEVAKLS